jgi:hypothetical protein
MGLRTIYLGAWKGGCEVGERLIFIVVEWSGMLTTLYILRLVHLVAAYSDGVFVLWSGI